MCHLSNGSIYHCATYTISIFITSSNHHLARPHQVHYVGIYCNRKGTEATNCTHLDEILAFLRIATRSSNISSATFFSVLVHLAYINIHRQCHKFDIWTISIMSATKRFSLSENSNFGFRYYGCCSSLVTCTTF